MHSVLLSILLSVLLLLYIFIYLSISTINLIMTQVNEKEISEQSDILSKVIKKKKSRPVVAILDDILPVLSAYLPLHIFEHSAIVTLSTEVNIFFDIFNLFLLMNLLCLISQYINQNADSQQSLVTNISLNDLKPEDRKPEMRE